MRRFLPALIAGLLMSCAWTHAQAVATTRPVAPPTRPAAPSALSADTYLAHVKYLASDELAGRQPGTPGSELAAEYIARQFEAAGLKPGGSDKGWFQAFDVKRGKKLFQDQAHLILERPDGQRQTWSVTKDWIPLPFTSTENVAGPLAFAGFGVQAEEFEYDDYAGLDAKGKILLIFRYEPSAGDPNAEFGGQTPSYHATFVRKAQVAAKAGALGLLVVNPPQRAGADDKLYEFQEELTQQTYDVPIAHLRREVAQTLLDAAGLGDLAALQEKIERSRKPQSTETKLRIDLATGVKPNIVPARNVIGLLPGDGSTPETIVIGAHYDHMGLVKPAFGPGDDTPQIHNGADDNASGTAGIIELARVLAAGGKLRRNVLFVAFDAEEMGLLGSRHFVEHPTVPLDSLKAMLNFDMIGRFKASRFTIYGIPSATEFPDLVREAAAKLEIKYRTPKGVPGNSDHASFYDHNIPVLFPFTGIHKEYHRPGDDWELIDADGAVQVLELARVLVQELATMREGPTFEKVTSEVDPDDEAMKPDVEHRQEDDKGTAADGRTHRRDGPSRPRVRLGVVPDYAEDDQPGVVAETVIEDGPARQAGMKSGDRIVRINDTPIKNIYGYMEALRSVKSGEELAVVVIRDGQELTLNIKAQATRGRRR